MFRFLPSAFWKQGTCCFSYAFTTRLIQKKKDGDIRCKTEEARKTEICPSTCFLIEKSSRKASYWVTLRVTEYKVFSLVLRWTGCCANIGICFRPRQLSLLKIQAVLPFFLLSGWVCLLSYLWGLLSYACSQQRMKPLESSILITCTYTSFSFF